VTDLVISRRLVEAKRGAIPRRDVAAEHILLIGSNRLSLLYIKFIKSLFARAPPDYGRIG
jgi:hypothetical protein